MHGRKKTEKAKFGELNAEFKTRYQRGTLLANTDGRTPIGKHLRDVRRGLMDHLGGRASYTQSRLIEEAAFVDLVLAVCRAHWLKTAIKDGGLASGNFTATYGIWSRLLFRNLEALGFSRPEKVAENLQSYLKSYRREDSEVRGESS